MKKLSRSDEEILLDVLRLVNQAMIDDDLGGDIIKVGASKIKKGWNWINCYQWLSGAKALNALSKIPEDYLSKNLGFDKQHAMGIIYAASVLCRDLNLSQGGNHEKFEKILKKVE